MFTLALFQSEFRCATVILILFCGIFAIFSCCALATEPALNLKFFADFPQSYKKLLLFALHDFKIVCYLNVLKVFVLRHLWLNGCSPETKATNLSLAFRKKSQMQIRCRTTMVCIYFYYETVFSHPP